MYCHGAVVQCHVQPAYSFNFWPVLIYMYYNECHIQYKPLIG